MSLPNELLPVGLLGTGAVAAEGYAIERSVRFNSADSAYLSKTFTSTGNRKTWTWAGWVKPTKLGTYRGIFEGYTGTPGFGNRTSLQLENADRIDILFDNGSSGRITTTAVFRDPSAWYHIVFACDTTQATASNRFKLYVNGSQVTVFSTASYPAQNYDTGINTTQPHYMGRVVDPLYADYYLADIHFIDGQALDPTSFGEFDADTGIWNPIAYSGSYGTNGFHLDFSDNSTAAALGTDTSGNSNTWTVNNISVLDGSIASASGALPIYNTTDTYGAIKGAGTRTDSDSSSIVLAIPMDGANNGTTFTDESATIKGSGSAKTITRYGDTKTVTSVSKYYGSSGYFDGTGDYLELAASSDFSFGSGDFTIECWLYANNTSNCDIFGYYSGSGLGFIVGNPVYIAATAGTISIFDNRAGGDYLNAPSGTVTTGVWTHIAAVRNGSDLRIYKDGISVASKTTSATSFGDSINAYGVGRMIGSLARNVNGYIQDFRIYKGVAKYTSNFNPPDVTAGAGNDSLVDVSTNGTETDTGVGGEVRGNYATLNPLALTAHTLANGNLDVSSSAIGIAVGTVAMSTGKWYWEITLNTVSANVSPVFGYINQAFNTATAGTTYLGSGANDGGVRRDNGQVFQNNTSTSYTGAAGFSAGDVAMIAFDADAKKMWVGKNGTWYNTGDPGAGTGQIPLTITGTAFFPAFNTYGDSWSINFGQRAYAYNVSRSGFKALCTANLPAPVVTKPSTVFDTALYQGTGSNLTVTGLGFSPDFIWTKARSAVDNHVLIDQIRGVGNILLSNSTQAEQAYPAFVSFDSNGFTKAAAESVNGRTYAAWCWDAGDSTVSNTDGSITSSVRANATAGFSIVSWTGTGASGGTIGHGLNAVPEFIIFKSRTINYSWVIYHKSLGGLNNYLLFDTAAAGSLANYFGSTSFTSTIFNASPYSTSGANSGSMVAYCFAPVDGYSSFGSYTGNGSTDGPFVYTGFRPRWVLVKRTSGTGDWILLDTSRDTYNVATNILRANWNYAELNDSPSRTDFLSNGFKLKSSSATYGVNATGFAYIYAAFAEHPFQYARAR